MTKLNLPCESLTTSMRFQLYLGQQIRLADGRQGKLESVSTEGVRVMLYRATSIFVPDTTGAILILHHLSTLRDEEKVELAYKILYSTNAYPADCIVTPEHTGNTVGARCSCSRMVDDEYYAIFHDYYSDRFPSLLAHNRNHPCIEIGWFSERKLLKTKTRHISSPLVWMYLIQKGYDCFGLIESGFAIRADVEQYTRKAI